MKVQLRYENELQKFLGLDALHHYNKAKMM
ncbi:hypothetical protein M2387_004876 [Klebsiella sp. BIGb0407]|nr:hypothetical protein [Klebsiella sp. BIGb0407]